MAEQEDGISPLGAGAGRTTFGETDTETTGEVAAERLRDALVDQLREQGAVRSERVEAALRAVPRHLFVPRVPVQKAYADEVVPTKHDDAGESISAASQPSVVAVMLEQLEVEPGQRVLEIGAGTGYNAALLAHLTGDSGRVTTIDVDDDLVADARRNLAATGVDNVDVLLGDGALGHPDGAPYDRIVATVGAYDLPLPWLEQLAPDGRLVVPLRLRGGVSRSVMFEYDGGRWRSRTSAMCGFMPLRNGVADDPQRTVSLTADEAVTFTAHQEQTVDATALSGVLSRPCVEAWTGVPFKKMETFEWMYLWLTCTMDNVLSRMTVERSAIDSGLVKTRFRWGSMATFDKGDFAYITFRPIEGDTDADDTEQMYDIGVMGHGSGGADLAGKVADQIRIWDRDFRSRSVEFEVQPADTREPVKQVPGRFTFDRPQTRLIISWV
ncbi:methyltransferase, FxLD system [Streptosporangium sp. NBC_01639]|uniref:methyltransferase, FxLD system n=1 Tax=Streptosporangium sp. NBC_01639 TaxID=2975948 RepID=UPI00386C6886|nr:methyltransferase, FxLD system [Streptosporangium sp. NBC_01639]